LRDFLIINRITTLNDIIPPAALWPWFWLSL